MIHKAALVSKTIPKRLHEHLSVVINVVNYVKSSALNTRLFSKLCKDMDANYTALLYHTQVCWLSKENMLSRIFELREKVTLFFVAKQKNDLLSAFGGVEFSTYLAYLADIFKILNQLNKKVQVPGSNVIVHTDAINAFVTKLKLWSQQANHDNFASFHHLTEITGDYFEQNLKEDIINYLQNLQNEFEQYFSEINSSSILMKIPRNLFVCKVEDVPEVIKEEFIELTNDYFAKDEFHICNLALYVRGGLSGAFR